MIHGAESATGGVAIETMPGGAARVSQPDGAGVSRQRAAPMATAPVAAPNQSHSPPPAVIRSMWGGLAGTARALGWRRFLFSDAAAAVFCLARPRRVAECANRHRRADPGLAEGPSHARARASYREYYRTCLDLVWAHGQAPERVRRLHPIDGWENIERARAEHGAGIFCLAHFGNWDMAATMALSRGLAMSTVMREFRPGLFNQVIVWARERRGLEVFTPTRAARGLVDAVRRGRFPALLVDIPEGGRTVEVRFRGGPVLFSTAPATLSRHSGCPLLPVACFRDGRHYRIVVDTAVPPGGVGEMTQTVADRLEALMALAPDQWYPFNRVWTDEP